MEIFLWTTPRKGLKAAGSSESIWRKTVKSHTPLSYLALFLDDGKEPNSHFTCQDKEREHIHTHTHTCIRTRIYFWRFLCLDLPADAVILSFLHTSGSPDTPSSTLGFVTMKRTLTHTGLLCLCCYSNLAACSPSPPSLRDDRNKKSPNVSTSGRN